MCNGLFGNVLQLFLYLVCSLRHSLDTLKYCAIYFFDPGLLYHWRDYQKSRDSKHVHFLRRSDPYRNLLFQACQSADWSFWLNVFSRCDYELFSRLFLIFDFSHHKTAKACSFLNSMRILRSHCYYHIYGAFDIHAICVD